MKCIVSVSKAYKHRGNHRHKATTKKFWHIYFYEYDDFEEQWYLKTKQINFLQALYYKTKKVYKRKFYCSDCDSYLIGFVKKHQKTIDCPNCNEEYAENS